MFKKPTASPVSPNSEIKPAPLPASNNPTANTRQIPQQWEYACLMLPVIQVADPNEILNQMGLLGWELVSTQIFELPAIGKGRELYFKRPITE